MPGDREARWASRCRGAAQLIRVLFCEIGRILSHLLNVTTQAMDVGALTPAALGLRGAREADDLLRARLSVRPAPRQLLPPRRRASSTCPPKLIDDIERVGARPFLQVVQDLDEPRDRANRIFKQRNVDIGIVSVDGVHGNGASLARDGARLRHPPGTCARAEPYECYEEMEFDIPVGKPRRHLRSPSHPHGGDDGSPSKHHEAVRAPSCCEPDAVRGRCRRSIDGKFDAAASATTMKRSMEALIHHFKLYTEGFHVPAGRGLLPASRRPRGSSACISCPMAANKPYRCKIRAPGFAHLQAMDWMCRRAISWPTCPAFLGTLDIVFGEVDR